MASVGLKFVRTFVEEYDVFPGHKQGEVEYDITRERWLTGFGLPHTHRRGYDQQPEHRGLTYFDLKPQHTHH